MNVDRLHTLFEHRDDTLLWKNPVAHRCKVGDVAGWEDRDGYRMVNFDGKKVPAHRIVWFMHNGPTDMLIDHIDGNPANNRISNLRLVTKQQNHINTAMRSDNSSGVTGVRWHKQRNKWNARIKVDGKERSLGMYENKQDAINARLKAELEVFGEYSRHYAAILKAVEEGTLVIQEATA